MDKPWSIERRAANGQPGMVVWEGPQQGASATLPNLRFLTMYFPGLLPSSS